MNIELFIQTLESKGTSRFKDLLKICEVCFEGCRISGSHYIFKTPWQGDPRINLQKGKGNSAKPYQVRQVLNALRKLNELEKEKAAKKDE